jgi:hypothetical protein
MKKLHAGVRWSTCHLTNKRGYSSKRAAKLANFHTSATLRVYKCDYCKKYHVTHMRG